MGKDRRKKICIVAPALTMGGMERASVNLANALNELGYEVLFLAILKQKHFFTLEEGIRFKEPDGFNTRSLSLLRTLQWLRQSITHERPDRVIVYNKFYAALTLLALAATRIPVFISERSSPLYPWPLKLSVINRIVFSLFHPSGIIAQTQLAAEHQSRYYNRKIPIRVIPNAIRPIKLYPAIRREKVILAVGRLNELNKGFDRLIEAFSSISDGEWKIFFAGNDERSEYLKKRVVDLNLTDSVSFFGAQKNMDELYAKASIFVIPSHSEGFPNALCEAMAAGLACISFDFIAGPRDIITDGKDGLLVENGNIQKLASTIQQLMVSESERLRLGGNALQVADRYKASKITSEYVDFIFSTSVKA